MSQAVNEIKKLPQGWRRAPLRETADIVRGISFPKEARGLAGKPLAGFRATPDRRIIVLCGMIVSVIRFTNPLLHR